MKIIKFKQPKVQMSEVRFCDKCSAQPTLRSLNYAYYVCSSCANKHNFRFASKYNNEPTDLTFISDHHISQVCAQKPVQTKPIRSRKRDYVAFQRNLSACRANESLASASEREHADKSSALLSAANQRLLKKFFGQP